MNIIKNDHTKWELYKKNLQFPKESNNITEREAWKYVDTAEIISHESKIADLSPISQSILDIVLKRDPIDLLSYRNYILNGIPYLNLKNQELPPNVHISNFNDDNSLVSQYLGSAIKEKNVGYFASSNLSSYLDGLFIYVDKNTHINHHLHFLYYSYPNVDISTCVTKPLTLSLPRTLIVVEENSSITLIEDYSDLGVVHHDNLYFQNAVTEIILKPGAKLTRYIIQRESNKSFHLLSSFVKQERDSVYKENVITIGGKISKQDVFIYLAEENAECSLNGLYLGQDNNYLDHYIKIEHIAPHCSSFQNYRGVLRDASQGVFQGTVSILQDASFSKAVQSNKSILLSDNARSYSKPQLEILTDEIECSHGSTIGQLENESLLYLRSRGLSLQESQKLLLTAFQDEILDLFEDRVVLGYIKNLVEHL